MQINNSFILVGMEWGKVDGSMLDVIVKLSLLPVHRKRNRSFDTKVIELPRSTIHKILVFALQCFGIEQVSIFTLEKIRLSLCTFYKH